MPVCKIVFRLDFKLNYKLIDAPGKIMDLLTSEFPENFWTEIRESHTTRAISGSYSKDGVARLLAIEPGAIYGSLETKDGYDVVKLNSLSPLISIFAVVHKLCEAFGIKEINRSGLRTYYFSSIGENPDKFSKAFHKLYNPALIDTIESTLGKGDDFGVAVDGAVKNGAERNPFSYRLKFGPHVIRQTPQILTEVADQFDPEKKYNFICDLDIFEEKFVLPNVPLMKWYLPIFEIAQQSLTAIESRVSSLTKE